MGLSKLYKIEFIKIGSLTHHYVYIEAADFCRIGKMIELLEKENGWQFENVVLAGTQYGNHVLKAWKV